LIVALGLVGVASVKLITAGQPEGEICDNTDIGGQDVFCECNDLPGPAKITALAAEDDGPADSNGPIAFAYIDSDGSVMAGTSNVSCTYNVDKSRYDITIEGEDYFYNRYVTVATCCGSFGVPITNSSNGELIVSIRDVYNNRTMEDFQFVTYKPKLPGMDDVIELTEATFDDVALSADVPVMVVFYTEWSSYCQAMTPIVAQIATEYKGKALVCQVDAEKSPSVNSTYGVISVPTFIFFKDGEAQRKMAGTQMKETLTAAIDELL
jgi:thioredoxin 1